MTVQLYGYSERGMVNAICDDILHSPDPLQSLRSFLSLCRFPLTDSGTRDFSNVSKATILVEQSFSDFGDLDLLLLLDFADHRPGQAIIIEAKVGRKCMRDHWKAFHKFMNGDQDQRSTLIVQLYRKMRLMHHLGGHSQAPEMHSVWGQWRLGKNTVVLKAAELLKQYLSEPLYITLVPDGPQAVEEFFVNVLQPSVSQLNLPEWSSQNIQRWGYLTWQQLRDNCLLEEGKWNGTARNLSWNGNQIFSSGGNAIAVDFPELQARQLFYLNQNLVYVVVARAGEANCRVVPAVRPGEYFPASIKVAKAELTITTDIAGVDLAELQPQRNVEYFWNPPANSKGNVISDCDVLDPPVQVKVLKPGWEKSTVQRVTDESHVGSRSFRIFNYHLQRK